MRSLGCANIIVNCHNIPQDITASDIRLSNRFRNPEPSQTLLEYLRFRV